MDKKTITILLISLMIIITPHETNVLAIGNNNDVEENDEKIIENVEEQFDTNRENNSEESDEVQENKKTENNKPLDSDNVEEEINDEELEEGNNEENEESEEVDENTVNILSNDQPTYAPGDKGEHVRELKLKLRELGFGSFPSNPSQTYGSVTERVVKEFQEFFRLPVTGVADETTRNKIDELLNSEYRNGKKGQHVRELKLKLTQLGFGNFPSNPSTAYGNVTERVVKEFQAYYNLPKSGIVDTDTENKIEEILNPPYKNGHRGLHIVDLKKDLTRLGFGNFPSNPSIYYGNVTSRVVREFQEHFGINPTGITDETTLEKINEILNSDYRDGVKGEHVRELKQKLTALGFGRFPSNPSQTYGSVTEKVVKEFQEYYGLPVTGIVDEKTMNKIDEVLNPPYQNGDRGVAIVELKEKLTALGFGNFPSNPSIFYGNVTSRVVKEFQQFYDLPVSGIADKATLDKIEELWESPYRNGKRGQHVKELKLKLTELGFGNFPSDPSVAYGNVTESVVKEFQSFYGLRADGIAGEETLQKIEEILANPFVEGTRADHVVQLKKHLTRLGFGNFPSNPSRTYGEVTMRVVKEFQEYYNLSNQSGNAGPETIKKMNEILNSPYQRGQKGPHVRQLKLDLRKLGFGSFPANPSQTYGEVTERVIREFQAAHDLVVNGIADEVTLAKIEELLKTHRYTHYNLTLEEAVQIQMRANPQTDQLAYVSKNYIDKNNVVTADVLKVRIGPGTNYKVIGQLKKGTKVERIGNYEKNGFYAINFRTGQWIDAISEQVRYYLNPENFVNDSKQQFQFLDLSRLSGASVTLLNSYLKDKGSLEDQGQAFIDAAILHGVNEVYLISHAILETGHGTSDLATGKIKVGEVSKNEFVVQLPNGRIYTVEGNEAKRNDNYNLKGIKLRNIYNMFGIGAYDSNPNVFGAVRAYQERWFTPYDAIVGGARFIGNNYIQAGQNTLYKIRWDPAAMEKDGRASHQYATDIGWAYKQVDSIYRLYRDIGIDTYYLDIPVYK